jgi:hypothetical protein
MTYAIRVEGAWLGAFGMTRDDDGATTVTLQVAYQARLHGVLAAPARRRRQAPHDAGDRRSAALTGVSSP